ncbi:MAG: homoserine O-acetyltransferase [Chloroflexota bacterium]
MITQQTGATRPRRRRVLPESAGSAGVASTRYFTFATEAPVTLESGRLLGPVTLAYETYGILAPDRGNAILACHALSGDAHAAGWSAESDAPSAVDGMGADDKGIASRGGLGWWDGMIGPGKAFDTDKYFVICSNVIGGCRGSTGPGSVNPETGKPYGSAFPLVTVGDMVAAQRELIRYLGITRLLAVAGGSLGGNQALQWAVANPDMVAGCIPIATCAQLSAMGNAFNEIGRRAIMSDPSWEGGDYYGRATPDLGLSIARMIGHVTYLSEASMEAKFSRRLRGRERHTYDYDYGVEFEVESYLRHQGSTFVERFDANSYLVISRAIDYFDLAGAFGGGSLERALGRARARFLVMSFSSDWLYPPHQSRAIAEAARAAGLDVTYRNLRSGYGHDAFLLEEARQTRLIKPFLARLRQATAGE